MKTHVLPHDLSIAQSEQEVILLDVRTPQEFSTRHAVGAINLPLADFQPDRLVSERGLVADQPIYVICKSGRRAESARRLLQDAGFTQVWNVQGGTDAWHAAGLPTRSLATEQSASRTFDLEQQVRMLLGSLVVSGTLLAMVHWSFLLIPLVIGSGLVVAGWTNSCLAAYLVSQMPWNQTGAAATCSMPKTAVEPVGE